VLQGLQAAVDLQPGLPQGLALLAGEGGGQLPGPAAGVLGGPAEELAAAGGRGRPPALEGGLGGGHGRVHIGRGRGRDLLEGLPDGRVQHLEPVAARPLIRAAVDEHRPHGSAPSRSRRFR
jgi:hypothetical protein